ncbi:MAG: hypothetical protein PHG03_00305 [Bacilli bacterium]|nr:hypothetical protein [Bacilli bacterium]
MKDKTKDIIVRALKTFIQGFLGALAITLPNTDYSDLNIVKSLLIGAVAGGISAVMNLAINYLNKKKEV